jgi:6-phosphogluconate dehydrogenase
MQLGVIGLGHMGSNIVRRLLRSGQECVGHDRNPSAIQALTPRGLSAASDLGQLLRLLKKPRAVWVMLGEITEKGEGCWSINAAIEEAVRLR